MATLFFDLDGTLLDVRKRHYLVYAQILVEMGVQPLPEANYWHRRRDGEGTLSIAGDLPGEKRARFGSAWMERIELPENLRLDTLYDGALPTLEALTKEHKLVLVTLRRNREALLNQIAEVGLAPYFGEHVYTMRNGAGRKATLVADIGLDTTNVWVIGDSEADTELAAHLNANCLCLTDGVRSVAFLRSRGGRLFASSLRPLPGLVSAAARS